MHISFHAPIKPKMVLGTLIYIIIIIVVIIIIIALLKFLFQLFFVAPVGMDAFDLDIYSRTILTIHHLH
jgi:hypothetical protein